MRYFCSMPTLLSDRASLWKVESDIHWLATNSDLSLSYQPRCEVNQNILLTMNPDGSTANMMDSEKFYMDAGDYVDHLLDWLPHKVLTCAICYHY